MAKRKIDEVYMKNLLAKGLPYKPTEESKLTESERKEALEDVEEQTTVSTHRSNPKIKKKIVAELNTPQVLETSPTDEKQMEVYRERFFQYRGGFSKMSFSADRELLQILRRILWDTESKTSLSCYVNAILEDHIIHYRALINKATEENIRKQTIPERY